MDDPLVARAVECDHRVSVPAAGREVVLGAAEVADAFLAGRRNELDRMLRRDADAVDLSRERQHDREATTIVVDAWPDQPIRIATNREIGLSREDRIEVGTDDDRRQIAGAFTTADDISNRVGFDLRQAAVAESSRHPFAALLFFARRRRDLRDRNLGAQDRVVVRGKARMSRRERTMCCARGGGRRRVRSHAFNCDTRPLPRKW